MNVKRSFCFYIIAFCLELGVSPAMAITTNELADICQTMESAIRDISLEYEWYIIPPWTFEEATEEAKAMGAEGMETLIQKDGLLKFKLSAAGLLSSRDPNDPNSAFPDQVLIETSATTMDKHGTTWDDTMKASYDGKTAKYLQIDSRSRLSPDGGISHSKRFYMPPPNLTPLGFSIFRLSYDVEKVPLSARLKHKEFVHLDDTIQKINEFDTIRADLLTTTANKIVYLRVYFSVYHGYTPVRYEYMRGGKPGFEQIAFTVEVHSLEQVGEGLWFPSSGSISTSNSKRVNAYIVTSEILVNRGLTEKDFDIKFPPGTKVRDEIKGVKYIVNSK